MSSNTSAGEMEYGIILHNCSQISPHRYFRLPKKSYRTSLVILDAKHAILLPYRLVME
jgi:hypothetical protein